MDRIWQADRNGRKMVPIQGAKLWQGKGEHAVFGTLREEARVAGEQAQYAGRMKK